MLSFSISYPDLIKFPYFTDTTETGDRGAKAEGDFKDNSLGFRISVTPDQLQSSGSPVTG
jgi:hypothetical protein